MDQYKFPCEPLANEKSMVEGTHYRFTIITDKVLRYEWAKDGVFEDRASTFAINRKFPTPVFQKVDSKAELSISTSSFRLTYDKKRFSPNGLGEPGGNLGGTARTLDGVDGRCDMGAGILSRDGYSVLDDSKSMLFDGEGFVTPRRSGARIDGYLFCYDHDYKGAMEFFYAISGRQPIVPRWCLGNWWSRYHAYDQDEYLALMDKFQENDIPMSVAVIDMDWHWVKGDAVPHTGWTGYTWNHDLFPDPAGFANALHERRLKMTLNDHPHAGIAEHEEVYEELAKVLNHDTTNGDTIQFDPTSPEFVHAFFNAHADDSYPIIFSRYGGPGSHRYPVGFSGDAVATWDSLRFQPEFTATASNIGYGWWSHDIGGHLPGYRDDECTARWVQYGAFSPILRLHSALSRWMSKEPWLYRNECMLAMKNAMRQRHRLVPYIFSFNASPSSSSPLPLVQPLYWKYTQRPEAYRYPNQYFFGQSLVVAPVVTPRDKSTNLAKTRAWLPPLRHVDIFTGTVYDGDREIDLYRPLDHIPVLAPEGSIISLDQEKVPANGCRNPPGFEVLIVVGRDGRFDVVEDMRDDREQGAAATPADSNDTSLRTIPIRFDQAAGRLTARSGGKKWTFRFVSADIASVQVRIDGEGSSVPESHGHKAISRSGHLYSTVAEVPALSSATSEITVDVGPNPQLSVIDPRPSLSQLINDFQTDFYTKDRLWEIIESKQPTTVKASRLLSLGLDEAFYGPVAELLLADSRS
ncbi:hypothetical protein PG994_007979 [Apiospora phragmitis]|uniref:alpha-glucosidase n=1 Tax=Apiospora phragmitis TaxID=2905665 RepID=A0ABR1URR6_9PEZI